MRGKLGEHAGRQATPGQALRAKTIFPITMRPARRPCINYAAMCAASLTTFMCWLTAIRNAGGHRTNLPARANSFLASAFSLANQAKESVRTLRPASRRKSAAGPDLSLGALSRLCHHPAHGVDRLYSPSHPW